MMSIDRSAPDMKFWKIWACRHSSGRVGNMRSYMCVDLIMLPSLSLIWMGYMATFLFECGVVMEIQLPVSYYVFSLTDLAMLRAIVCGAYFNISIYSQRL